MKLLRRIIGESSKPARHKVPRTGRQPLHEPGFPLVLMYSQKAGCTSLVKWFFFQIGKLEEATRYDPWIHRYRTKVFLRQPGYKEQTDRLLKTAERPVIKLVRNPYDRAVSSFLHVVRGAERRSEPDWEMEIVRGARQRAGKPAGKPVNLSFRDFMRHVAAIGTDAGRINQHVARQHVAGEEDVVTRLIRVESFAADIRQLEAEFALAASPIETIANSVHHLPVRDQPAPVPDGCLADLDITFRRDKANDPPPYAAFYDEETAALVRTAFSEDFAHYGYDTTAPRF